MALLEYLLTNRIKTPPPTFGTADLEKRELRRRLFDDDPRVLAEAKAALRARGFVGSAWNVFEGRTAVDAYLETDELIVLIEGKRTESRPTTKTSWMSVRHQMLRNIDAVWDNRGRKNVVAFFIVEGTPPNETEVPARWRGFVSATVAPAALEGSLPHRSAAQRQAIAQAFVGATTWQAVCAEFEIAWSEIRDLTWEPIG